MLRIRRCRQVNGTHRVVCSFIRNPAAHFLPHVLANRTFFTVNSFLHTSHCFCDPLTGHLFRVDLQWPLQVATLSCRRELKSLPHISHALTVKSRHFEEQYLDVFFPDANGISQCRQTCFLLTNVILTPRFSIVAGATNRPQIFPIRS
jgi:hypothetical protein